MRGPLCGEGFTLKGGHRGEAKGQVKSGKKVVVKNHKLSD